MKRKKKPQPNNPPKQETVPVNSPPKKSAQRLGITAEILLGEPKITVTGDYLVEITNHKGIISLSEEQIEINTRKYVYKIRGKSLMITALTDEEVSISGNVEKIEKL